MTRIGMLALACCLGLLAGPALAQGSGSGGGGSSGGASGGSGSTGATSQGGQQPASPGQTGPGQRARTEQRLRDAGVAPPPHEEERQLRDLNEISRQIAPRAAPPAPEVDRSGR